MTASVLLALIPALAVSAAVSQANTTLHLDLRYRKASAADSDQFRVVHEATDWDPRKTAAIVCDMWDKHWCVGATRRVAEMAPVMDRVLERLRSQGVFIIHAPSDTMTFYSGTPQRLRAQNAPHAASTQRTAIPWHSLDPSKEPPLPIDDSDGGCDDVPPCKSGPPWPWTREIATIHVADEDAVTDNGAEVQNLLDDRGIHNVIVMGVHANMCVLGRPFSIRRLVGLGKHVVLMRDMTDTMYNSRRPPYASHFTGTDLVVAHIEEYWCPSITSDQVIGGQPFRFSEDTGARDRPEGDDDDNVRLPTSDTHYQQTKSYVEETPGPGYMHASQTAREAFRDMKFGIRIHWGIYSIDGKPGESWPFLTLPPEGKQRYQELYKTWDPRGFSAEEWVKLFERAGAKCFAMTAKHHEGFSMFDTQTRVTRRVNWTAPGGPKIEDCDLAYSIMETPFHRDVVGELCAAAHKHGMKIDLYFSHPDWYDADFRPYNYHPLQTPGSRDHPELYGNTFRGTKQYVMARDPTSEETARMMARHRQQLTELLTRYGKIDMMCLDQWLGKVVWPQTRATIEAMRKLQPDVMLRCRGIGNYGDYYTPEGFVPGARENTDMPWMVIYPLAGSFSYVADASKYHDGAWIVRNLVDSVAKGGNFMVGIGPDRDGRFHAKAIEALESTGDWLRVNGAAIYATRPRAGDQWKEDDALRFTRTKDGHTVYALALAWPGPSLHVATVQPVAGSKVRLLGYPHDLAWHADADGGVTVDLPAALQDESARPCHTAWAFQFEVLPATAE